MWIDGYSVSGGWSREGVRRGRLDGPNMMHTPIDPPPHTHTHTNLAVEEALGRLAAPLLALVDQVVRAVEAVRGDGWG